ncbi:MAG: DinB family protein [Vicinamibacterales bacterium]
MTDQLAWALDRARAQTLSLVADVPDDAMGRQLAPGEPHPGWLLGHLLLADTYLLFLLGVEPLPGDFQAQLERYGPASAPTAGTLHDSRDQLVHRLRHTHERRLARIRSMTDAELARPLPDAYLAQAQPTIGHHLHSQVFHEGYHAGQLASWRKAHGFAAVRWTLGPGEADERDGDA